MSSLTYKTKLMYAKNAIINYERFAKVESVRSTIMSVSNIVTLFDSTNDLVIAAERKKAENNFYLIKRFFTSPVN